MDDSPKDPKIAGLTDQFNVVTNNLANLVDLV
jgi:hypothetical protein